MSHLTRTEAEELLFREALLLDTQEWDAWLDLYQADAVYWVPAWRDETTPTDDPDRELSLIYYKGRSYLEERVWRARSRLSVASTPLPRAVHGITNVLVTDAGENSATVTASFTVHVHDVRAERTHVFFGRYEHRLVLEDDHWSIASKKILLLNDRIPTIVDFYML